MFLLGVFLMHKPTYDGFAVDQGNAVEVSVFESLLEFSKAVVVYVIVLIEVVFDLLVVGGTL